MADIGLIWWKFSEGTSHRSVLREQRRLNVTLRST